MKKINSLLLFVIVLFVFCSCSAKVEHQTSDNNSSFSPSWFNFKKDQQKFTLTNPLSKLQIQFQIEQKLIKVDEVTISQNGFWRSIYYFSLFDIKVIGKGQNGLFKISKSSNQSIKFIFKGLKNLQSIDIYTSEKNGAQELLIPIKQSCNLENNDLKCESKGSKEIYVFYHQSKSMQQFQSFRKQLQRNDFQQIQKLAQALGINLTTNPISENTIQSILTNTLSCLCVQTSEYEGYQYYGLCSNTNTKQIERHYSLLTIDILFKYNPKLAAWLTQNFLNLLEEKLFYSFTATQWIPLPEHVEVFLTYIKHVHSNSQLSQKEIKNKINKVIQIQNGLINNLLLSQVNHLSEQINYRQKNKVHPSILKMLNQVWKTDLPRAKVSSIYAESFTSDFFYHQKNQKLQTSVGKIIWLIKLINQHIKIIRTYGDSYQKESLQQLKSLSKVMNGYVLDDPKAQNGDFYSIVITENLRVYSKSLGYESLLPFTYGISSAFPINTMLNLTTPIGLASMPLSHHKVRQTYNFRGNINLYFNYKILFGMIQRCNQNIKSRVYLEVLQKVVDYFSNLISNSLKELTNQQKPLFYTAWNPQGKGVASENYLSVLNLSFLKNLETLSNDKNQKSQQSSK